MNVSNKINIRLLALSSLLCLLVFSCKDDNAPTPTDDNLVKNEDAAVPLAWMGLFLKLDRHAEDYRPGPAARTLAYINLAAYEAVMDGMPEYNSLKDLYPNLSMPPSEEREYHYPTVLNTVYASLIKRLVPGSVLSPAQQSNLQFEVLELEQSFNESFSSLVSGTVFDRSKAHGEAVANAFFDWATTDSFGHNAHESAQPTGYSPPSGPGLWQPAPPSFGAALFPYWGKVRCFAIEENDKVAEPPLSFSEASSSQLYVQALEVKNTADSLDFANQWVAEFWNDDFVGQTYGPVARWVSITSQVLETEGADLETALYAYAKISIALNDAGVAAWHSKYTYNVERPVSYIRRVFDGAWTNHYDSNPSHPTYPSGHASFGAAAAETLSHVFGYNYSLTDFSHDGRTEFLGMPRTFETFYEMAEENAYSRIPLGTNFRMDAEEGVRLGLKVGRKVNEMPFK